MNTYRREVNSLHTIKPLQLETRMNLLTDEDVVFFLLFCTYFKLVVLGVSIRMFFCIFNFSASYLNLLNLLTIM